MSSRDKQREEAVAASPMVGGRRNAKKSGVQIAQKPKSETVTTMVTKPENTHKPESVTTMVTKSENQPISESVTNMVTKLGEANFVVVDIKISDITPWDYANRPDDEFGDDEEWHAFVQSIKNDGVNQPVTVRPKKDGNGFELICGRRRYIASTEAGRETIPCIVRELTDIQASVIQDQENELRKDLSVWARAVSWQVLLDNGVFKNKSQLGAAMDLDRRYVHKVMVYMRIPKDIVEAIYYKKNISMGLAQEIVNFTTVKDGQDQSVVAKHIEVIKGLGNNISEGGYTAQKFRAAMKSILSGDDKKKPVADKLPKNLGKVKGVKCFNVRRDSNGTPTISILKEARDLVNIKDIAEHLEMLFEDAIKK